MELRHLRYFVAVATEEHFGRAASCLGISTPPLSRQLKELAAEIGVPLFKPVGRGVKLTAAGAVLLERARAILADVDHAAALARATSRGEVGQINIRFAESTSYQQLVPAIVARFRRLRPHVDIHLVPISTIDNLGDLQDGLFQAAYCYQVPKSKHLRSEALFRERILLAVGKNHPLARRDRVRIRELHGHAFILPPRSISPSGLATGLDKLQKLVNLKIVTEVVSSGTRLNLVASGMGLTLVSESARSILPGNVTLRPLADCSIEIEAFLAWKREDDDSPLVRSLLTATRSVTHRFTRGFGSGGL